jgi:hypothetical protein
MEKYREVHGVIMKCCNNEICGSRQGTDMTTRFKLRKLEGPGHVCRMDGSKTSGEILEGKRRGI